MFEKTKVNEKEAVDGPFLDKNSYRIGTLIKTFIFKHKDSYEKYMYKTDTNEMHIQTYIETSMCTRHSNEHMYTKKRTEEHTYRVITQMHIRIFQQTRIPKLKRSTHNFHTNEHR